MKDVYLEVGLDFEVDQIIIFISYLVSLSPTRSQPCLNLINRPQFRVTSVLLIIDDYDTLC